jgi:phosphate transport system substrate-binding protein
MRRLLLLLITLCVSPLAAADGLSIPPPPHEPPPGVIRIWGNAQMELLVRDWVDGFTKLHPNVRVELHLTGSDVAMAGLYTGKADIALLGREATEPEAKAFEWIYRYAPTKLELMTGSLDKAGRSPALVVFVHKDNPLEQLSLPQLDAIFGEEHRTSPANIRDWAQLGLTDGWAGHAINLYAPDAESGTGRFFREHVLGGSTKMNWDHLLEFAEPVKPGAHVDDFGRRIVGALARDRYGIALGHLPAGSSEIKALAIRRADGEAPVAATRDTLTARQYPLMRTAYAYVNRAPGQPLDANARAFLRYALGAAGQRSVERSNSYLPLPATAAANSARRLD